MIYDELYKELKVAFDDMDSCVELDGLSLRIRRMEFHSQGFDNKFAYPLSCMKSNQESCNSTISQTCQLNNTDDGDIQSNTSFDYYIFENIDISVPEGIIFLFHGLNEKKWDKYLPWAYELTRQTGKSVILFPIAFHMNRAPLVWSDSRLMSHVAKIRSVKTSNSHSSFANAALSERLELVPQRLFWSGLQTYNDFYSLIRQIQAGQIDGIPSYAGIDLFGYSIGAFFSLLLMMDNPDNLLKNSKLFIFCGGATYDRTFPVSKYIVDRRAFHSVTYFFEKLFKNKYLSAKKVADFFINYKIDQSHFAGLMCYNKYKDLRENRLAQISERINAIVLTQDEVVPPGEVVSTLQGESGNININTRTMDFDFTYNHVIPFPVTEKFKTKVDYSFKTVFETASSFFLANSI